MNMTVFLLTALRHHLNRFLTREHLRRKNELKFRRFVKYLQIHSPYYSRLIASRGIEWKTCYPEQFPVMTKTILMDNFDDIVTDRTITRQKITDFLARSKDPLELFNHQYYVLHTSGSSGEMGYFVYSKRDWARSLAHICKSPILRFKTGKKRLAFFGAAVGHFTGVTFAITPLQSSLRHFFEIEIYDINRPIRCVIEKLNAFQPDVLLGYPSGLRILAEKQLQNVLRIAPSLIQISGEALNGAERACLETAFPGSVVLNFYSSTEHLLMGSSAPGDPAICLFEDDFLFELHEDDLLATNLFNYTLPLIRYRMSDVLVPSEHQTSRPPYLKINEVIGRMENAPVFINKHGRDDFISPHTINEIYERNLRRFQMRVLDKETFIFKCVLQKNIDQGQKLTALRNINQTLRTLLSEKEMDNVVFRVEEVQELEIDKNTRKFKLVVHN